MDFYTIGLKTNDKTGITKVYPEWSNGRRTDLMTTRGQFKAFYNAETGFWSTDIYDLIEIVDKDVMQVVDEFNAKKDGQYVPQLMSVDSHGVWKRFQMYLRDCYDNYVPLDSSLTFANKKVEKSDYASKTLPYSLSPGNTHSWDTLISTLYDSENRQKIEWAIGAVVAGEAEKIQKFLVFYGAPGTGKSTILNIIGMLFGPYSKTLDADVLVSDGAFASSALKDNALVGITHDADFAVVRKNSLLNSIVSHETIVINEKFTKPYPLRPRTFLFVATNKPVEITDQRSGLTRRLIDVIPTGHTLQTKLYENLMHQINFELGAIAWHCHEVYKKLGPNHYNAYRSEEMMTRTDPFYNFVLENYDIFVVEDGISLKRAWVLYKEYCDENKLRYIPMYKMRDNLRDYFEKFHQKALVDGKQVKSYFEGFKGLDTSPKVQMPVQTAGEYEIVLQETESVLDNRLSTMPAQYANKAGTPYERWEKVTTTLSDLDTHLLHYVKVPKNHVVIDFDLTDEDGNKSLETNIRRAAEWPPTYTEVSKSGQGLHLHYNYEGDTSLLANLYDVGIEVKTYPGNSALRRKLTRCNDMEIATISAGLPKKEKKVLDPQHIKSEKGLRHLIERNLRKEIHPGTKPSIDFIAKILQDAHDDGLAYDVTDLRGVITIFAAKSTNHARECIKTVNAMEFKGKEIPGTTPSEDEFVFFDVEVYPNLLVVCWKVHNNPEIVKMINPTAEEIEPLFKQRLIGFNNRRYDNHILYARYLGYSNEQIYKLSKGIIDGDRNVFFAEAYNLSYADIYDFSSKKQGLKKFMIELGIFHLEVDYPWDEPVPEESWPKVIEYCANDVAATEAVFEARKQDFAARQILAELSGLSVNHTTQSHTARIIFGKDRKPSEKFVYTDLSERFEGYEFDGKESRYRGENPSEGGYVYAEAGAYENVAVLDVESMHPTSIEELNLFGPYTPRFAALTQARLAIKHQDYETARTLLDGKLGKFLGDDQDAEALAFALKIVINIVYGLTSASFDNPFRDNRNKDNIVAKRGALFMIDLKNYVQEQGFTVAHIKTDSIKIPNATKDIIDRVVAFGRMYGYTFTHETTYEKFCLVNDAVYVARDTDGHWTAVGAQFQHPFVFKTLFSGEEVVFDDFCEAKSVTKGSIYIDFEDAEDVSEMRHIGRTGSFVPVVDGGGRLWRVYEGKKYALAGTKNWRWVEREVALNRMKVDDDLMVDSAYFETLQDAAKEAIGQYVDFESFIS